MTHEEPFEGFPLCDFERIRYEVRPCDVLLIEGRSRVSRTIQSITQSSWTHSCLYIGRLHDVDDLQLREKLKQHFKGEPNVQLVIEGYVGKGTIASPLNNYETDHIRICRPRGLSRKDAQTVMAYAINQLGVDYDVRQILDLARFLVPWSILPRQWRSSLFDYKVGRSAKTVCSTMIAEAFCSINFPILPLIKRHEETGIEMFSRNPKLITPRDFDYSPYFEIIKYPFIEIAEGGIYRQLPWNVEGKLHNIGEDTFTPSQHISKSKDNVASPPSSVETQSKPPKTPGPMLPHSLTSKPKGASSQDLNIKPGLTSDSFDQYSDPKEPQKMVSAPNFNSTSLRKKSDVKFWNFINPMNKF